MFRTLRNLITGLVIGLLLGLWFGVNIGKDQPWWSNPFAEPEVGEQLKRTGDQLRERGADIIRGE